MVTSQDRPAGSPQASPATHPAFPERRGSSSAPACRMSATAGAARLDGERRYAGGRRCQRRPCFADPSEAGAAGALGDPRMRRHALAADQRCRRPHLQVVDRLGIAEQPQMALRRGDGGRGGRRPSASGCGATRGRRRPPPRTRHASSACRRARRGRRRRGRRARRHRASRSRPGAPRGPPSRTAPPVQPARRSPPRHAGGDQPARRAGAGEAARTPSGQRLPDGRRAMKLSAAFGLATPPAAAAPVRSRQR